LKRRERVKVIIKGLVGVPEMKISGILFLFEKFALVGSLNERVIILNQIFSQKSLISKREKPAGND
jgi:hypothetical protein